MGNSSSSSPSASASPPSTGNQAAKPMAKTKKTSIQQKQKPNNTYKNNQNNNNNNNNNKTSTLSSSPPLSLFQKAAVTRHAITDDNDMDGDNGNGNGNTTSTATPLSHKGIWDYYDKLEQIAQGSTCDIFTVTRKTTTTATETATTSSSSSSKSKPTYVVKQMIKDRVSKAILEEMQAEIDILSTLDHPHVVLIYETFQDKHNFYIVMEHLKGGDLYSRRSHYYTEPQVAKIMTQICSAMVYCHENNVVHRDIKMEYETKRKDTKRNHPHI
jgi:Protein kinase domain